MSKRPGSPNAAPPPKRARVLLATTSIGCVTGQEDLQMKVLVEQNKQLSRKLKERHCLEDELTRQLKATETQRETYRAALGCLHSIWNRVDNQVQALLVQHGVLESLPRPVPNNSLEKLLKSLGHDEAVEAVLESHCTQTTDTMKKLTAHLKHIRQSSADSKEAVRLHSVVDGLRDRLDKVLQYEDTCQSHTHHIEELNTQLSNCQFDLTKSQNRCEKLEVRLAESMELIQQLEMSAQSSGTGQQSQSSQPVSQASAPPPVKTVAGSSAYHNDEELQQELDKQRQLASQRLSELERLQEKLQESIKETQRLQLEARQVSDSAVKDSPLFMSLQSQYAMLYTEHQQSKSNVEDLIRQLQDTKQQYLMHLEKVEADDSKFQQQAKEEMEHLADQLSRAKVELQTATTSLKQHIEANEQAGPIIKELRLFVTSQQNQNKQLKAELTRYKRKLFESNQQIERLRDGQTMASLEIRAIEKKAAAAIEQEKAGSQSKADGLEGKTELKESKAELKKAQENVKEMKLLLDALKSVSKEQREKVELLAAEQKTKAEVEELKKTVKAQQERIIRECVSDSMFSRRWHEAEENIKQLHRELAGSKQDEQALLGEMEVTGQAFEEMQEQNMRLLQQLQEKDDANFRLLSDRIQANTLHEVLRKEREAAYEHVTAVQSRLEASRQLVVKFEEKEKSFMQTIETLQKDLTLRQQVVDQLKKKAVECAQSAQDRKMQAEKSSNELKEAQALIAEKVAALEKELHRNRRLEEESANLRHRTENVKQAETTTADEILQHEVQIYRAKLSCPCCNTRKKDCILTKCYHLFCFECVRTRYETRQRKCPKCNAAFGSNDYHRIYL